MHQVQNHPIATVLLLAFAIWMLVDLRKASKLAVERQRLEELNNPESENFEEFWRD